MADTAFKAPELGSTLAERYELLRFLGSGAIGAVYEARTPTNERVAVKVLLEIEQSALAQELSRRFIREARLASTLDSNHVVPVVDSGVDEHLGIPYLVMPLLSGFDLETLLDQVGALHPTVAVRIAAQACSGLMAAHKQNVVHRDIKPGNVFLAHQSGGAVIARVLDFGIAKQDSMDEQITRAGTVIGTPHYMSPEQSKNSKEVDARSDVWGLAATLYHALCGVVPFDEAKSFADLHIALNTTGVPPIQGRAPWLDPGLARVVHGALLLDPAKRCPSVSEFRTALMPFLQGSTSISSGMLEGVPEVMRRVNAPLAERPTEWERSTPKVELPPMEDGEEDPLLGKKLGGDYRLLRQLGRGSSGGLYEAIAEDGNRFAVRVLDPKVSGQDEKSAKRFVREAQALAAIVSPHVVRPVDAGYDDTLEQPFVVVEMLHGMDLRAHLDRHGPLSPRLAVNLFLQVCRGIEHAHEHGVIHRDIRPANLFLVEEPGGHATVKITGFGMVKQLQPDEEDERALTVGGDIIGSPLHMAPEQARNARTADARSDLFGVAASLFHALTGAPPWPAELPSTDLLVHIMRGVPGHLQDHAPWVSKPLTEIVHRALKRDPAERWPDITAFAEALATQPHPQKVGWHQLERLSSALTARRAERAAPAEPAAQGAAGSSPGATGSAPGATGSAPGAMGSAPGAMGSAPGAMGSAPGAMGSAPGAIRSAPGGPSNQELIDLGNADTQIAEHDEDMEQAILKAASSPPPAQSPAKQSNSRFVVLVIVVAILAAAAGAYFSSTL